MAQEAKFCPTFFLDVFNDGHTFPRGEWPLHITLFPPVNEAYNPEYGRALRDIVNPMEAFDVVVGKDENFGDRGDTPVKLIEPSEKLMRLHEALVRVLENLSHDPTYRQPYRPHVAVWDGAAVEQGMPIHIGGLSLVEKRPPGPWTVVDKVGLWRLNGKDRDETTTR